LRDAQGNLNAAILFLWLILAAGRGAAPVRSPAMPFSTPKRRFRHAFAGWTRYKASNQNAGGSKDLGRMESLVTND
jgi:hypothetical protein